MTAFSNIANLAPGRAIFQSVAAVPKNNGMNALPFFAKWCSEQTRQSAWPNISVMSLPVA